MDRTSTTAKPLPFFFVGQAVTEDRRSRYISQKHGVLTQALGKPDTKSIWYSREHIAKLLEEIDYNGGDGLRIYLGAYESGHDFAGQLCLLMNVTRETNVGGAIGHTNVVLENEPDFGARSAQNRDVIEFPGESDLSRKRDFNLGSPCPPRCPDGDEG